MKRCGWTMIGRWGGYKHGCRWIGKLRAVGIGIGGKKVALHCVCIGEASRAAPNRALMAVGGVRGEHWEEHEEPSP